MKEMVLVFLKRTSRNPSKHDREAPETTSNSAINENLIPHHEQTQKIRQWMHQTHPSGTKTLSGDGVDGDPPGTHHLSSSPQAPEHGVSLRLQVPRPADAPPPARPEPIPNTPSTLPLNPALPSFPGFQQRDVWDRFSITETINLVLHTIEGATAAFLADHKSGMALGMMGSGVNLELVVSGTTDVVRAKLRTLDLLGIEGQIEDILITLDAQYHIIALIPGTSLFLEVVLQKDLANLALARHKLKTLVRVWQD